MSIKKLKIALGKTKKEKSIFKEEDYLSTGSTHLNIAYTGKPNTGIPKGIFSLIVGDSSTRKTWIAMTVLAEASINRNFDDYALVFNNSENGALMNLERYFGSKLKERLDITYSEGVEDFYDDIEERMSKGPVVYILDSMDVLMSRDEKKQIKKEKDAAQSGKDTSGSYGTSRAKINSTRLRGVANRLRKTKSILIIISQTRQNIGFTARLNPKTRSGGEALRFYNRLEIWLSLKEKIKSGQIRGKERIIGQKIKAKIVKNHITGWEGTVDINFYRQTGMDNTGTCIDYLIDEKHWKKGKGGIIKAVEFKKKATKEELVQYIENNGKEDELNEIVLSVWKDIESKTTLKRKNRYAE